MQPLKACFSVWLWSCKIRTHVKKNVSYKQIGFLNLLESLKHFHISRWITSLPDGPNQ